MVNFTGSNLTNNLFLLVTSALAFAGWVVAFGGSCALAFTGAGWWIVVFELLVVVGVILLVLTGTFLEYRLVILAFLAVSVVYLTGEINGAIALTHSFEEFRAPAGALAAGYIILIIIHIAWIFVFGSEPHSYFGKFAQHSHNSVQQHPAAGAGAAAAVGAGAAGVAAQSSNNNNNNNNNSTAPNETIQDKTAFDEGAPPQQSPTMTHPSMATSPVLNYSERVEALHDYHANPEDPTELSFDRGDLLEIVDRRGNWWQARKADGSTGIIPSNYFA